MKQILLCTIISIYFFACTQDNTPTPGGNSGDGIIKFDANGQHIEYSGSYASLQTTGMGVYGIKLNILTDKFYTLDGQSGANNVINLKINTDTLQEKSYNLFNGSEMTGTATLAIDGKAYSTLFDSTQKFVVDITRHSGGIVHGTFKGNLYWPKDINDLSKGFDSVIITNGEINNMEMIY